MGRRKLTKILLEAGPDLKVMNQQKETSLDIAKRKNHQEIWQMINNPPPVLSQEQLQGKKNHNGGIEIVDGVEVIDDQDIDLISDESKSKRKPGKKIKIRKNSRNNKAGGPGTVTWSPYGCHYFPDPKEFPDPNPSSLPEEPLNDGEQYFLDLAGNIKKGPVSNGYTCYCAPLIERVEKKMNRNKKEMFRHLDLTHGKLSSRISHLEKKTKEQISGLSNNMKETFAQERLECQDRMERRAIRDRIHMERQEALRDMMLRGDLSSWLEKRVADLERNAALKNSEDAAFMRTLLRSSKRRKKSFLTEIQSGTLRRAASEDYLPGEEAEKLFQDSSALRRDVAGVEDDDEIEYEGGNQDLRVSDHPHFSPAGVRVRRNSAGDEMMFCDFGDFNAREIIEPPRNPDPSFHSSTHHPVYQNQIQIDRQFGRGDVISYSTNSESHSQSERGSTPTTIKLQPQQHPSPNTSNPSWSATNIPIKPPLKPLNKDQIYQNYNNNHHLQRPIPMSSSSSNNHYPIRPPLLPPKQAVPPPYRPPPLDPNNRPNFFVHSALVEDNFMSHPNPMLFGMTKTTSDGGSHDSHNDSGYCTRPGGGSGGPSPSLSGSQGRPDSRLGPMELFQETHPHHQPNPLTSASIKHPGQHGQSNPNIGPRIRQLQNQLSLATLNGNPEDLPSPRGSLV